MKVAAADAPVAGVLPLIAERVSPSVFDPAHSLSEADVAVLLDAARWAPSWGNTQPVSFLVGRRHGDAWNEVFDAVVATLSRGNRRWVPAASAIVVTLEQVAALPCDTKPFRDDRLVLHDVGQAVAYLTLQAHSMGLAVHQFAGFDADALTGMLGIDPRWHVAAALAVGRAWPEDERDEAAPALVALRRRVPEYDLAGNAERERKPRRRRPLPDVLADAGDASGRRLQD